MKRKSTEFLVDWLKRPERKPLVIRGAKQGKLAVRINSDYPSRGSIDVRDASGTKIRYELISLPFYLIGQLHRLIDRWSVAIIRLRKRWYERLFTFTDRLSPDSLAIANDPYLPLISLSDPV